MEAEVTMYDAQVKKLQGLCDEHDLVFKLEKETYPIRLTISQVQKQYEQGTLMPDMKKEEDNINHPAHYTQGTVECIDAIESSMTPEEFRGYLKGCQIKYIWRYQHKGGMEDLKKARWYLDRLIKFWGGKV